MLWTDPKMTFYGRTMVKIKMILNGWRIAIQLKKIREVSMFFSLRILVLPYILESNPHPNLIHTSFCRFFTRKNSSRFQSAPFLQPPLACKADWLNNIECYQCFNRYPTNAPCVKWPFYCQRYKRTAADDSDWVTDNDSVEWWRRVWWIINYKYYIIYYK